MNEQFLQGEKCDRCGGPLLAEAVTRTDFVEVTLDYVSRTVWICYGCGKEHALDSQPYFTL